MLKIFGFCAESMHDVTNWGRKVDQEARESTLLSIVSEGVVLVDSDGNVQFLNRTAEELFNTTLDKAKGELFDDLIKAVQEGEQATCSRQSLLRSHSGGTSDPPIVIGPFKASTRWLSLKVEPLVSSSETERPIGSVVQLRDVSEQMRITQSLRESEEKFQAVAENAHAAFGIVQGIRFVYANKYFSILTGYSVEEILQMDFPQMVHPDFRERMLEYAKRRQMGLSAPSHYEFKMLHKNGEPHWVDFSPASTIYRGKPAIIGTGFDVTERRQAEEALRQSEATLKSFYTNSPLLMGIVEVLPDDSDVIQIFDNPATCRFFGLPLNATAGKRASELNIPLHTLRWWIARYRESEQSRTPVSFEYHGERQGVPFWLSVTVSYLGPGSTGGPRIAYVAQDISHKKQAEEERLRFELELAKAQKLESIGVLAGGIAHDFNNLLAGLFGHIEIAKQLAETGLIQRVPTALDNALNCFERAKDLTKQLLTFSKGGAPVRKAMWIGSVLKDATLFALSGSNLRAELTISQDLWPCDVDEHQITQAVDNIVRNAREAMPHGGVVSVKAENVSERMLLPKLLTLGKYVHISITDHGPGIPKEHLTQIFDPFFTTKETGHGLGLSIAYSVIKRHDGIITADSELGKGSTFHIYLPTSAELPAEVPGKRSADWQSAGRVLLMDDEEAVLQIATHTLNNLGYAVTAAMNGEEAISLYRQAYETGQPFDLAILDLTIRDGMGGKETVRELRKINPQLKALVSSGYSNDPVMMQPDKYGFDAALAKPYKAVELGNVVGKIVHKSIDRSLAIANR